MRISLLALALVTIGFTSCSDRTVKARIKSMEDGKMRFDYIDTAYHEGDIFYDNERCQRYRVIGREDSKIPVQKFADQQTCFIIADSGSCTYDYIDLPTEIMEVSKNADTPTVMNVYQQGNTLVLGFIPRYTKNSQK